MIPIEQQVTSLQVSKELKQIGIPQGDSYFVWFEPYQNSPTVDLCSRDDAIEKNFLILCDAFTETELFNLIDLTNACGIDESCYWYSYNPSESRIDRMANALLEIISDKEINPQDLKL